MFLQWPEGVVGPELSDPVIKAAAEGGASLFVNGVDPGFANDVLPLTLTGISERIDQVRCVEVLSYNTYDQAMVLFDIMGFGGPMDEVPFILSPGVLTTAWGSVVRQIGAGLDVELDGIEEGHERVAAPEAFTVDAGRIEAGTTAGMHFEVRGMKDGRAVVVLEHATACVFLNGYASLVDVPMGPSPSRSPPPRARRRDRREDPQVLTARQGWLGRRRRGHDR